MGMKITHEQAIYKLDATLRGMYRMAPRATDHPSAIRAFHESVAAYEMAIHALAREEDAQRGLRSRVAAWWQRFCSRG